MSPPPLDFYEDICETCKGEYNTGNEYACVDDNGLHFCCEGCEFDYEAEAEEDE